MFIRAFSSPERTAIRADFERNQRSIKKNIKMVMKEGEIHVDRRPGKSKSAVQADHKSWKIIDYL